MWQQASRLLLELGAKANSPLSEALKRVGRPMIDVKADLDRLDACGLKVGGPEASQEFDVADDAKLEKIQLRLSGYYESVQSLHVLLPDTFESGPLDRLKTIIEIRLVAILPRLAAADGVGDSPHLMVVRNVLERLTHVRQTWIHASSILLELAQRAEDPLAEAFRSIGEPLQDIKSHIERLEVLGLSVNNPGAVWKPGAGAGIEIQNIQRHLSAFRAAIQNAELLHGEDVASSQLDKLERTISALLLPILAHLIGLAKQDRDALCSTKPLRVAMDAQPQDRKRIKTLLAELAQRREATDRHSIFCMAMRDVATSRVAREACHQSELDIDVLEGLLHDTYERAAWGPASLISAPFSFEEFEEPERPERPAVIDALKTFAISRRLTSMVSDLINQPRCRSTSFAIFKLAERAQLLITDFIRATDDLSEDGWDDQNSTLRAPNHAFQDVLRMRVTWQAIADDLIYMAESAQIDAADPKVHPLSERVIEKAVDIYFNRIESKAKFSNDERSLWFIEEDYRSGLNGNELIQEVEKQAVKVNRTGRAHRARSRPHPPIAGTSDKIAPNMARETSMLVALPQSAAATQRILEAEAKSKSRALMENARKEATNKIPDRALVKHYLDNGRAHLERAELDTKNFDSNARSLTSQVNRVHWSRWPSEELYLALKDEIEVLKTVDRRSLRSKTDSNKDRPAGAYIDEVVLRVRDPRDLSNSRYIMTVMHIHHVPGKSIPPSVHFKLFDRRGHASRQGDRVHRGFILHANVWQGILARANTSKPSN